MHFKMALAQLSWAGMQCIGCSLVCGPDGQEVLSGPYGISAEALLYVDVETVPRPARGHDWAIRWASGG